MKYRPIRTVISGIELVYNAEDKKDYLLVQQRFENLKLNKFDKVALSQNKAKKLDQYVESILRPMLVSFIREEIVKSKKVKT